MTHPAERVSPVTTAPDLPVAFLGGTGQGSVQIKDVHLFIAQTTPCGSLAASSQEGDKPMTYKQQFEAAMKCETLEEAKHWLTEEILRYGCEYGQSVDEAKVVILANLGYMAGYYDHETAQKVHKLFGAVHPVFGCADYHNQVTPEQAFAAGQAAAVRD